MAIIVKRKSVVGEVRQKERTTEEASPRKRDVPDEQRRGRLAPKTLRIAIPPGIGDSLWSLTKIPAIKRTRADATRVVVCVKDTDLNRSHDFLRHFSFIDDVCYEPFSIHPESGDLSSEGPYIYEESREGYLGAYDWLLISNGHLERGGRLETWLPEFETDFDIGKTAWRWRQSEISEADLITRSAVGGAPYCVFYLGPSRGNTVDGHNRGPLWSLSDWAAFADACRAIEPDLKILIVGAPYDKDYAARLIVEHPRPFWVDKCGQTRIGVTYALCRGSKFVLSYQSGIGIFSAYLGVRSAVWWRPYGDSISPTRFLSFDERMASAWAPPWSLGVDGNYVPLIYGRESPEELAETFSVRGWFDEIIADTCLSLMDP